MRRIILEFIGGAWDGMNLANDSPDRIEVELAVRTYCGTRNGEVGQKATMPSNYTVQRGASAGCEYVVEERTVVGDEVLVRMTCTCDKPTGDEPTPALQVVLEFDGGYLDGRRFDSQSDDVYEALLAVAYYHLTDQGTVGSAFDDVPVIARPHGKGAAGSLPAEWCKDRQYRVVQRIEEADRIVVRFEYQPKAVEPELW
jgi:hypothetical protein